MSSKKLSTFIDEFNIIEAHVVDILENDEINIGFTFKDKNGYLCSSNKFVHKDILCKEL